MSTSEAKLANSVSRTSVERLLASFDVQQGHELEARIGAFHPHTNHFTPGVSRETFMRLLEFHQSKFQATYTEDTCLIFPNNERYYTNDQIKIVKEVIDKIDLHDYGVRVALAKETKSTMLQLQAPHPSICTQRYKKRWSFTVSRFFRLDMTIAQTNSVTAYEVEMELLGPAGLQRFVFALHNLLQYVQNSYNVLTAHETQNLEDRLSRLVHGPLSYFKGAQPRTLQQYDLDLFDTTPYAATIKVDGVKAYMLIDQGLVFLMDNRTPGCIRVVGQTTNDRANGTVLEGELTTDNWKEMFWAFDVLFWQGADVRERSTYDLRKRLECLELVNGSLPSGFIRLKPYLFGFTRDQMLDHANSLLCEDYQVKTDGLIFVPINEPYSKRARWQNLLKWKDDVTIDFRFRDQMWWVNSGPLEIPFKPEHAPDAYIANHVQDIPHGSIVECRWDPAQDRFEPLRLRPDKTYPNFLTVALDNMHAILNPLTKAVIAGQEYFPGAHRPSAYRYFCDSVPVQTVAPTEDGGGVPVIPILTTAPPPEPVYVAPVTTPTTTADLLSWVSVIQKQAAKSTAAQVTSVATEWKMDELKMYLQSHGLPVRGRRQELLDRVLDHKRSNAKK